MLLRRKQLEIGSTRKRRGHSSIRRNLERWHIIGVDWTVGDEQYAQCFLRRVQSKQRGLDKAIVDRDFLSGAQPVEPGAAAQPLQRRRDVDLDANDAFVYRVYAETTGNRRPLDGPLQSFAPHPTGVPDGSAPGLVPSNLVVMEAFNETLDKWLPDNATTTAGKV